MWTVLNMNNFSCKMSKTSCLTIFRTFRSDGELGCALSLFVYIIYRCTHRTVHVPPLVPIMHPASPLLDFVEACAGVTNSPSMQWSVSSRPFPRPHVPCLIRHLYLIGSLGENPGRRRRHRQVTMSDMDFGNWVFCICIFTYLKMKLKYL